jgi:cytoskeletal protein CcmA (bactofilin family)
VSNIVGKKADRDGAQLRAVPIPLGPPDAGRAEPSAASGHPRATSGPSRSVIGGDLTIIGNLVSRGEVQIDGEVQGDVHAAHVVIAEGGRVTGAVAAEEVAVRGEVMGAIRASKIVLQSTSRVEGDLCHQSLAIEQGAYFEGKSRRSADPLAGVSPPEGFGAGVSAKPEGG